MDGGVRGGGGSRKMFVIGEKNQCAENSMGLGGGETGLTLVMLDSLTDLKHTDFNKTSILYFLSLSDNGELDMSNIEKVGGLTYRTIIVEATFL